MNVYAESSAVLAWLAGEPAGDEVGRILAAAEFVIASELTLTECRRALVRAQALGTSLKGDAFGRQARLAAAANTWTRLPVDQLVLDRAGRRFPVEPVKTLDAIHLATVTALP